MIIVVNNANILIDLVQLDLLSNFFDLEFTFHTTDLVLNELHKHQQDKLLPYIEDQVLLVTELSDVSLEAVIAIKLSKPKLSEQD